ncbi:hypothetical protein MG296_08520 [Flavobacteriaceae bacterium TK19130]|nr:hypothetical protein [Thermobacterium salinum]
MKLLLPLLALFLMAATCDDKKEQQKDEEMIPVEKDNGIGDGAPSLDSILDQHQSPPIIPEGKRDSIVNAQKNDSI